MDLSKLFGSRLRVKLLCILSFNRDEEFYQGKLAKLTEFNLSGVQKELAHLTELGLVRRRKEGNRVYYKVETNHFLYRDLMGLLIRSEGLAGVLRTALEKEEGITFAFIYGSFAKRHPHSTSDIDLMIIGSIDFGRVVNLISEAENELRREINPRLFSTEEFKQRIKDKDHFVTSILEGETIFVIGNEDELRRMAE